MQELIQKIKQGVGSLAVISESLEILKRTIKEDEPLYRHSLRIGLILQKMGADEKTIACGLLQHVPKHRLSFKNLPEHTKEEISVILKKANQLRELCSLSKTTKPKPLKNWQKVFLNQQAENLRRMFFAITHDIRPIFITLVDWLDAIRYLVPAYQKDEQTKKSIAALEILAPLAYGIGMGEIKGQLEDAAFPYLYPKEYNWLMENVKEKYTEGEEHLEKVKPQLMKALTEEGIPFMNIHARAKYYFSLYQKLLRREMDIEKIYDLVALRVVVPDIASCYRALGLIHNMWKPLYGRIKDYIASPKPNGYRSLHTTVACHDCDGFMEIQIKTPDMHREAEYGAAAHFGYKEEIPSIAYKHQFYWMDQLRQWREETKDLQKMSSYLQSELFKEQVFVFTPKGDVINLPKGATPVDLAYAVHSEIGDRCEGAKVNGKMVNLKQNLKTGETVEIIIGKNKIPSQDWLRFVKTHKAQAKIKSFLEETQGISFAKPSKVQALKDKVALIKKILPRRKEKTPQVLVGGASGISIRFSKCCSPKPGDTILAFITKGEGASLHKAECQHLQELKQKQPQRIVEASWKS